MITKNIDLEKLIDKYPISIKYLRENNIKCVMCGDPIDCTLEEACKEKNIDNNKINKIVIELNELHLKYIKS